MARISFDNQVAIVTGGGRGLGRSYALELARRGASVVVNDVAGEHADAVVAEIAAAGGRGVASHESVASQEGGAALVRQALDSFGTVDAVINNAGILRNNFFEDLTLDQIDAVLDVNLRGVFFVTQPAWRVMKAKGYGRVVLTSSAAGLFSRPGSVNYSAAKAAMYGMTRALSFEGADHGIRVNMILPRATTTISAGDPIPVPESNVLPAEVRAALAPRRSPDTTAPLVCYLASRACEVSGEAFSSAAAAYARVFVGRCRGWVAPDPDAIAIEDVIDNLDAIREFDGYTVPLSNGAEILTVAEQLGVPAASTQA
jgi:NAD(P)-dependent dehydrogenase (short-subunit alcohol dehydrogenase family)